MPTCAYNLITNFVVVIRVSAGIMRHVNFM